MLQYLLVIITYREIILFYFFRELCAVDRYLGGGGGSQVTLSNLGYIYIYIFFFLFFVFFLLFFSFISQIGIQVILAYVTAFVVVMGGRGGRGGGASTVGIYIALSSGLASNEQSLVSYSAPSKGLTSVCSETVLSRPGIHSCLLA